MKKITPQDQSTLTDNAQALVNKLRALHGKYAMLRRTQEYKDILKLAKESNEILINYVDDQNEAAEEA